MKKVKHERLKFQFEFKNGKISFYKKFVLAPVKIKKILVTTIRWAKKSSLSWSESNLENK